MRQYPKNWGELTISIKQQSNWTCYKCGRSCLRPGEKSNNIKPRSYNLQVHHWNRDPSDNRPENLVSLCAPCHLDYHRGGKSNISPGQLSLFDGYMY